MRIKLTSFLVFAFFFQVSATVYSQKITLHQKNAAVETVLRSIERQSGYVFLYDNLELSAVSKLSIDVKGASLERVLAECFKDQPITYKIFEKTIVLKKKEPAARKSILLENISGKVLDEDGLPLPGAGVAIKNTQKGVVTNTDGTFSINASEGDILVISFLGYISQEVKVEPSREYIITLLENKESLSEVVVVGYGTQKKSSLTAAVASVSAAEIQKQVSSNVASALQGRTPGVEIVQQGGVAGADVNIIVRGAASFGATEPLYVIDGIFSNTGLRSLSATDIESIEVLKDGAAAAIYGSRASNGVVLITTKKGKAGKPVIEVNTTYSSQTPTSIPDFLNAAEWRAFANQVADNSGLPHAPENDNPTNPDLNTDWAEEWLQYAPVYNFNGSISGGNENSTFNTSVNFFDQKGMTIFSGYKKYNMRLNHAYKKGIFSISETAGITYRKTTPTTAFNIGLTTLPIYDAQGRFTSGGPGYYINPEDGREQNKIAPLYYTDQFNKDIGVRAGINASLQISEGLEYRLSVGGNYGFGQGYTHSPVYFTKYNQDGTPDKDFGNPTNRLSESRGAELSYTIDNIFSYKKALGKHNIDALLGTSWLREFNRNLGIGSIADLGGTSITGVSNVDGKISASESNSALLSFFTRLNYDFDNRYLFSASIRRDESSKFHEDFRVGYFPAISAGWNIHEEDFFGNGIVDRLKLRASYGELGANFLNPYNFDPIAFGPIPYTFGDQRYVNGRGAYLKSKGLKWETAKTYNLGIDASFLNDQIYFTADYFVKKNTDLLAAIDLNLSSGQIFEINTSREKPYVNSASVENKGLELLLGFRRKVSADLNIDASLNFAAIENKVLSLGDNVQPITSGGYSSFFNDAPSITRPGEAIGSFYGYKISGFDSDGNFIFNDENGDGLLNANDKVILGSPIPDFSYGMNFFLTWKNLDLTMFFQGVSGNEIFNARKYTYYFDYSNNVVSDALNAWRPDHKNTNIPVMKTQNTNGGNALPSEFYIEDGSYFRFKNLQLGYNLPLSFSDKFKIAKLRLSAGVQNLFTVTSYSGYDPEVSSNALFSRGIDFNSYPNARTYTVGLNMSF